MTLTDLTIAEAADQLLRREVSCVEVVEACLRRIEETEPIVHAWAFVGADAARSAAEELDREFARGSWRGPLHGIPIGVKDVIYTKDSRTEGGSRTLAGFRPSYDATVVRRLRDSGAILLGKTETHEFAYGQNIPPTRNPWNAACYPGGSSVGSGVATAVGSAFAAIGTDTGGSVRVPAAINGVVGLKPTFGRVSRHGCIPLSTSLDHVGPIARSVEDAALLLQAIAGHDPLDRSSSDRGTPDFRAQLHDGLAGVRIGLDADYFLDDGLTSEVRAAIGAALDRLEDGGATVVDVRIPELELTAIVGMTLVQAEASGYHRTLLRERGGDYAPGTRLMLEFGELLPTNHYVLALRARSLICRAVERVFRLHRLDSLIGPALPWPTVPLEQSPSDFLGTGDRVDLSGLVRYGMPGNVLGLPVLTQPCGFSGDDLPIAVSFFGRPFDEPTLFRIGRALALASKVLPRRPTLEGLPRSRERQPA
jgi:aspartyl-tRNA(Asn)/glutamyl-tRNA(Gln) amidotransferase subunit A